MKTKTVSRANDPTYRPSYNFQQLALQYPNNRFIALLAEQERGLSTHRLPEDDAEQVAKLGG
jgi:hypothetical protein